MIDFNAVRKALTEKVTIPITSIDHLVFEKYIQTSYEFMGHILLFDMAVARVYISTLDHIDNYVEVFAPFAMTPDGRVYRVIPKGEREISRCIVEAFSEAGYELKFLTEGRHKESDGR